jgi:hypothetical protein
MEIKWVDELLTHSFLPIEHKLLCVREDVKHVCAETYHVFNFWIY